MCINWREHQYDEIRKANQNSYSEQAGESRVRFMEDEQIYLLYQTRSGTQTPSYDMGTSAVSVKLTTQPHLTLELRMC